MDRFGYQSEKFSTARSCLMLPFPKGESEAIASAFHECYLGLKNLDRDRLDANAREWVATLEEFMNTSGIEDSPGRGKWAAKADQFTEKQKFDLAHVVDELASWFHMCFWQGSESPNH